MPPIIPRIILIVFGILLFVCAMLSYAGKKLKEGFLLGWCLFALFFILAGIIPALSFCTGTFAVFSGPAQMILSALSFIRMARPPKGFLFLTPSAGYPECRC